MKTGHVPPWECTAWEQRRSAEGDDWTTADLRVEAHSQLLIL